MLRILLVEDEAAVRSFMSLALGRDGHQVTQASSGAEAVQRAAEADFDLVITDVIMPEMSGIELVGRLRSERPTLPVLFISGYSQETQRAVIPGHYLQKPFSIPGLLQAAKEAAAHGGGAAARGQSAD